MIKGIFLLPALTCTLCILAATGCANSYSHKIDFNPSEPIRVAVLPFDIGKKNGKSDQNPSANSGSLAIDNVALLSSKLEEEPPQILRRLVLSELGKTDLDLVSTALIDIDLPHHGFATAEGNLDLEKLLKTDPKQICSDFLTCDAILYGKITRWDRDYYGLQTVNSVGLSLTLVSAKDGKTLFQSDGEDSESRGITKGPTGFSSLIVEPIRGLDSDIIVSLSRQMVKKMLLPLSETSSRPGFLESAPPSIYGASHDGQPSPLKPNEPLIVVMFGSEGQEASFSIGKIVEHIPMYEKQAGHYYGEYLASDKESFQSQPVVVFLRDKFGRVTEQKISRAPISASHSGLLASKNVSF